jgi:hypothetical protein
MLLVRLALLVFQPERQVRLAASLPSSYYVLHSSAIHVAILAAYRHGNNRNTGTPPRLLRLLGMEIRHT